MKNYRVAVGIVLLLLVGAGVQGVEFVLEGEGYKEVNTGYSKGELYGLSKADVVEGGSIDYAYLYDHSIMNVVGGNVGSTSGQGIFANNSSIVNIHEGEVGWNLLANDDSTVNMTGGHIVNPSFFSGFFANGNSSVNISGGTVDRFIANSNSTVNISSGNIGLLTARESSNVSMWGGVYNSLLTEGNSQTSFSNGSINSSIAAKDNSYVEVYNSEIYAMSSNHNSEIYAYQSNVSNYIELLGGSQINFIEGSANKVYVRADSSFNSTGSNIAQLDAFNLRSGVDSVHLSGGSVEKFKADIVTIENHQYFHYSGNIDDLASYGVQASGTSIGNFSIGMVYAHNDSHVNVSGGSMSTLYTYDNTYSSITGGWMNRIDTSGSSTATIEGGIVNNVNSYNDSSIHILNGKNGTINAYDSSTINFLDGRISSMNARNDSVVNIYGGTVTSTTSGIKAYGNSEVFLSGGELYRIYAYNYSIITLIGYDFELGSGLSWGEDGEILGRGLLTGKWIDETDVWTIDIRDNWNTATILAIPEPTTLLFFGLGGLALRQRKR